MRVTLNGEDFVPASVLDEALAQIGTLRQIAVEEHESRVEWEELYEQERERNAELTKALDRLKLQLRGVW